jgi:hypothetical protein
MQPKAGRLDLLLRDAETLKNESGIRSTSTQQ